QTITAPRPEDPRHPGMRVELQLGLHHQSQRLMPTAEVHWPRCNQDRQSLARDDHAAPRMARTRAATRSTGTSPGTRITKSGPISRVRTADTASGRFGGAKTLAASLGSATIAKGTNAGAASPFAERPAIASTDRARTPSPAWRRQPAIWFATTSWRRATSATRTQFRVVLPLSEFGHHYELYRNSGILLLPCPVKQSAPSGDQLQKIIEVADVGREDRKPHLLGLQKQNAI